MTARRTQYGSATANRAWARQGVPDDLSGGNSRAGAQAGPPAALSAPGDADPSRGASVDVQRRRHGLGPTHHRVLPTPVPFSPVHRQAGPSTPATRHERALVPARAGQPVPRVCAVLAIRRSRDLCCGLRAAYVLRAAGLTAGKPRRRDTPRLSPRVITAGQTTNWAFVDGQKFRSPSSDALPRCNGLQHRCQYESDRKLYP